MERRGWGDEILFGRKVKPFISLKGRVCLEIASWVDKRTTLKSSRLLSKLECHCLQHILSANFWTLSRLLISDLVWGSQRDKQWDKCGRTSEEYNVKNDDRK